MTPIDLDVVDAPVDRIDEAVAAIQYTMRHDMFCAYEKDMDHSVCNCPRQPALQLLTTLAAELRAARERMAGLEAGIDAVEQLTNHSYGVAGVFVPMPVSEVEVPIRSGVAHSVVWTANGEIVVLGQPSDTEDADSPDYHNCDSMGCGQHHVLARKAILSPEAS